MVISLNGFRKELDKFVKVISGYEPISNIENDYLGISSQDFSTSSKLTMVLYYLIVSAEHNS